MCLKDLTGWLDAPITAFACDIDGRLHFVTHSMGGLVASALIARRRLPNLGRVVALASPNRGSEVADLLRDNRLYIRFFGPACAEFTTNGTDVSQTIFGVADYPLGVIAGDRTVDPIASFLVLPRPNGGRVSVARAHVDGMAGHIVVHASHALIMQTPSAVEQSLYFLRHGRFRRPEQRQ